MFCKKCGKKVSEDADFCVSCGETIEDDTQNDSSTDESKKKKEKSSTGRKMNFTKIKRYAILALIVIFLIVFAIVIFQISGCLRGNLLDVSSETIVNVSTLEQQLLSIGELALVEYNYKSLITMQDSHKIGGWNIPLTQKSFIITVEGRMKIGIDTSDVTVNASEQTKNITIRVPRAKILSHELFEETLVVLEESSGLFNKISIEDWATMAVVEKQAMEEKTLEGDVFERAENDAVRMLQAFITSIVPEEYTVVVTIR